MTAKTLREFIEHVDKREPITHHLFLRRLREEPCSLERMWVLMANFQIAISNGFARHLATIAARVDDDRIRCILAKQLNDELGNGDYERAHVNLFRRMMSALESWRPEAHGATVLAPGKQAEQRVAEIYGATDAYAAVGAVALGEVVAKQLDLFLGEEFRRQSDLPAAELEWLIEHEELEVEHAESSTVLVELVRDHEQAALRGARDLLDAGRDFLTDVGDVCFGPLHPRTCAAASGHGST
jgi:pyrroloquinoline quinone (PQQ) biosynthesis protein C